MVALNVSIILTKEIVTFPKFNRARGESHDKANCDRGSHCLQFGFRDHGPGRTRRWSWRRTWRAPRRRRPSREPSWRWPCCAGDFLAATRVVGAIRITDRGEIIITTMSTIVTGTTVATLGTGMVRRLATRRPEAEMAPAICIMPRTCGGRGRIDRRGAQSRHDRQQIRGQRNAINGDRQAVRGDLKQLRADKASGNTSARSGRSGQAEIGRAEAARRSAYAGAGRAQPA